MPIDVKEAVKTAKKYVATIFDGEDVARISLEEVWFDSDENEWSVTVGIRHREIGARKTILTAFDQEIVRDIPEYKVVRMTDDGELVAIQNYERIAAE
jgi:predicted SnoaL-like aldol condensation-catalyzing enzyme